MARYLQEEMNCSDCQAQIEEYIVGELDDTTESMIASHLTTCDSCQHELRLAETINTVLADMPKPTTPPNILQEVTAYVQTHPNPSSWIDRFANLFDWLTPRQLVLRICAIICLVGIALFGVQQHQKQVIVEQAKHDFNYAISMMQYAVNKTGLAVNDRFKSLNIEDAPKRALKSTSTISSAIDRSLGILNRLTEGVSNTYTNSSQTESPTNLSDTINSTKQGEKIQ